MGYKDENRREPTKAQAHAVKWLILICTTPLRRQLAALPLSTWPRPLPRNNSPLLIIFNNSGEWRGSLISMSSTKEKRKRRTGEQRTHSFVFLTAQTQRPRRSKGGHTPILYISMSSTKAERKRTDEQGPHPFFFLHWTNAKTETKRRPRTWSFCDACSMGWSFSWSFWA